jgi:hypothetical protein
MLNAAWELLSESGSDLVLAILLFVVGPIAMFAGLLIWGLWHHRNRR